MTSPAEAVEAWFPKLPADGYRITSRRDDSYNCVAWIARDIRRWWEPDIDGCYWPHSLGDGYRLADYLALFESLGFVRCPDGSLEDGREKIAIYATANDFEHVAFQRSDGEWSSKLGPLNDIRHAQTDSLVGRYPPVAIYMARVREEHPVADSESGLIFG